MRKNKLKYLSLAALGFLGLASCDKKEEPVNVNKNNGVIEKIDLSDQEYDLEKEYFYSDYNERSLADATRQGIKTFEKKDDIVFDAITYEELVNILESEGNYLILFGGSWCHNTRAAAPFINEYANEYGIDTIYNFDFYLDGTNGNTHIRNTNNTNVTPGIEYNYLYGELVTKYLTNLNDYVEYTLGSRSSLTYTNNEDLDVNVPKLQVPFLFLYNKDNKTNNSGKEGTTNTKGTYPIVYGFEEMIDLDKDGVYKTERVDGQSVKKYQTEEYKQRLKTIFDYIKTNNVELSSYTDSNYIKDVYNAKASEEIFKSTDKVNIKTLTYRQLVWLLNQEGNSIIFLGGTWCPNTQATIKTTNEYAVKNNVIIYNFDTKLDSGLAKKYWGYTNDLHIRDTANSFVKLYTELIEKYLTNIVTLYDVNDQASYKHIEYTDENGSVVKVKKLQVPYLLSYNKDAKDLDGFKAPITSYYEEMLVLAKDSNDYVYKDNNYNSVKSHTKNVIDTYLKTKNKEALDI